MGRIKEGHFGSELEDIGLMSFQEKVLILAKQQYGRNQSSQIHGHVRAEPWTAQLRTARWGRNKLLFFFKSLYFLVSSPLSLELINVRDTCWAC